MGLSCGMLLPFLFGFGAATACLLFAMAYQFYCCIRRGGGEAPSTSAKADLPNQRASSIELGSVSVSRGQEVMLRCYGSDCSGKESCLWTLGPCETRHVECVQGDISLIKEEVTVLRKQVQELVISQKEAEVNRSRSLASVASEANLPPPPPSPSSPSSFATSHIVMRKQRLRDPVRAEAEKCHHEAMFANVLKGLGTVKLNKVEKSASGTPLRKSRESDLSTVTEPAGTLAEVLKKRFVFIHPTDSSNDSATEPWSPSTPQANANTWLSTLKEMSSDVAKLSPKQGGV